MLFQVSGLAADTTTIAAALRALDPGSTFTCDLVSGQVDVSAQLTSAQVIAALAGAGYHVSRVSEPKQIHVSGGSDCCGSCS